MSSTQSIQEVKEAVHLVQLAALERFELPRVLPHNGFQDHALMTTWVQRHIKERPCGRSDETFL